MKTEADRNSPRLLSVVNNRNEQEEKIAASDFHYSDFYEHAPHAYFTLNATGLVLNVNQAAVKTLKTTRERIIGSNLFQFVIPEMKEACGLFLRNIFASPRVMQETKLVMLRDDGIRIRVRINAMTMHDSGAFRTSDNDYEYCYVTLQDITDKERIETFLQIQRDLCKSLSTINEEEKAIDILLDSCIRIEEVDFAVYYTEDERGKLKRFASKGVSEDFIRKAEDSSYELVVRKLHAARHPFYIESKYITDIETLNLFHTYEVKAVAVLPILCRGRIESCILAGIKEQDELTSLSKAALESIVCESGDIFIRIRMEAELRHRERQLRGIIDNASAYIYVKDLNNRFQLVNNHVREILGLKAQDMLGKTTEDIFPAETAKQFIRNDEIVLARKHPMEFEEKLQLPDGEHTLLALKFPLSDDAGNIVAIGSVTTDITQLKQTHSAMRMAIREAESANSIKSQFIANMSHEIRTPMNAIIGFTEMVLNTPLDENQHQCLNMVRNRAKDLLAIINDILEMSKIEAGKMQLKKIPVNIQNLVDDLVVTFREKAEKKHLKIQGQAIFQFQTEYLSDPLKLRQVLGNLLDNAIKFTDRGTIVLTASQCGRKTTPDGSRIDTILFTVSDSGCGIPKNLQDTIFEPFTQVDESRLKKHEGTGLGLSICKKIVEAMNGRIWVESDCIHGSSFFVKLDFPQQ